MEPGHSMGMAGDDAHHLRTGPAPDRLTLQDAEPSINRVLIKKTYIPLTFAFLKLHSLKFPLKAGNSFFSM